MLDNQVEKKKAASFASRQIANPNAAATNSASAVVAETAVFFAGLALLFHAAGFLLNICLLLLGQEHIS